MKALALLLLAAFIGKGKPIELWRTPLPGTLVEIRLSNGRSFLAPTPLYFENLKFGCGIVAKDLGGKKLMALAAGDLDVAVVLHLPGAESRLAGEHGVVADPARVVELLV